MSKFLLIYNYVDNHNEFTVESSDADYLKAKVSEIAGLSGLEIEYKIVEVIEEGRSDNYLNPEESLVEDICNNEEHGLFDTVCPKCGGWVGNEYKHVGADKDGEGGYDVDIFICRGCGDKRICPD